MCDKYASSDYITVYNAPVPLSDYTVYTSYVSAWGIKCSFPPYSHRLPPTFRGGSDPKSYMLHVCSYKDACLRFPSSISLCCGIKVQEDEGMWRVENRIFSMHCDAFTIIYRCVCMYASTRCYRAQSNLH